MREQRSAWRLWLSEPFRWIISAFVNPEFLEQEFSTRYTQRQQRLNALARLAFPLLLAGYFLAFISRAILLPLHLVSPNMSNLFTNAALALVGGLGVGLVLGFTFSIREGLIGSLIGTLTFGLVFDFAGGFTGGFLAILAAALAIGIALSFTLGLVLSRETNSSIGLTAGLAGMLVVSGIFDLIFGLEGGLVFGLASGIVYFTGYLGLPFYLASSPSAIRAYLASRRKPADVFDCLHHSALYWDEYVSLPLPFLKRTLLIAYKESPEKALEEIAFIRVQRPGQRRVARQALEEIALSDLEKRINLERIAGAERKLAELFSAEDRLIDPRLATPLTRLSDASRDAMRAISPIGLLNRRQALEDLQANLLKVQAQSAFREQRLNLRLTRVVENWRIISQQEQERLTHMARDAGNLANPYKPGQFLSLQDSLFVGRRNLAQELEGALSTSSRRPTFLLNGERRMGKTSALQQLPFLLGSSYVSVFYNLQQPGLYASTATFLGVLADGIVRAMNTRAMPVENLVYGSLRTQQNDASIYSYFETWLAQVEKKLAQENRTLLLAFDEFEMLEEVERSKYIDIRMLLDWMRSIIQFHSRVALLFSGVKIFTEMGTQSGIDWAGYFINVQMLRISFLTTEEARHLILQPNVDFPGEQIFPSDVVEAIITETGCHPFLLQAVCSALITLLNVQRREQATGEDVTAAAERVLEDWGGHFAHLWNRTDNEQRACLEALLSLQRANTEQLAARAKLDVKVVRRTLQQLHRRDLVVRDQEEVYGIAVPMFRCWLEQNV